MRLRGNFEPFDDAYFDYAQYYAGLCRAGEKFNSALALI